MLIVAEDIFENIPKLLAGIFLVFVQSIFGVVKGFSL